MDIIRPGGFAFVVTFSWDVIAVRDSFVSPEEAEGRPLLARTIRDGIVLSIDERLSFDRDSSSFPITFSRSLAVHFALVDSRSNRT